MTDISRHRMERRSLAAPNPRNDVSVMSPNTRQSCPRAKRFADQ